MSNSRPAQPTFSSSRLGRHKKTAQQRQLKTVNSGLVLSRTSHRDRRDRTKRLKVFFRVASSIISQVAPSVFFRNSHRLSHFLGSVVSFFSSFSLKFCQYFVNRVADFFLLYSRVSFSYVSCQFFFLSRALKFFSEVALSVCSH